MELLIFGNRTPMTLRTTVTAGIRRLALNMFVAAKMGQWTVATAEVKPVGAPVGFRWPALVNPVMHVAAMGTLLPPETELAALEMAAHAQVTKNGGGGVGVEASGSAETANKGWSGVKGDVMRLMDRALRRLPKRHGATKLFSRCFVHAMMFYNDKDVAAAMKVAIERWPSLNWSGVLYRHPDWVNRPVRRFIPGPVVILPRVEQVFKAFQDVVGAKTGQPLFNAAAKKAARQVLELIKGG